MNTTLAIGAIVLMGAFYAWTSRINGMFFFGRSAESELRSSSEGQNISRQYLTAITLATCLAVLLAWLGGLGGRHFAAIGILVEGAAFWGIFARANRQVRALEIGAGESAARENILQVPLLETPSYWVPSLHMALLPAVFAAISFAAGMLFTEQGMGWNSAWNAWNRSLEAHHLDALFGMSLGMLSSATLLLIVFRSTVRLRTRLAQYTVRASVVMEWVGVALLLTILGCNYMGVSFNRHTSKTFIMTGLLASLGTIMWNQARAKRFVPPPVELGADDRWRWGLFYTDRNDPALFVQSRCGAGYSLNYGRMMAWPISLAIMVYFVSMLFLPAVH